MSSRKLNAKLFTSKDKVHVPRPMPTIVPTKPVVVHALIAQYVPTLRPSADVDTAGGRELLMRKTWRGATLSRYTDGYELVYPDGRKLSAAGKWTLMLKVLRGAPK
jgi:hypothetical protein